MNEAIYEVTEKETGKLILLAPLETLVRIFRLYDLAKDRVVREYEHCELFNLQFGSYKINAVTRQVNVEVL